ncbi:uncharacterized protein LOC128211808 isoform X1 [Mya arenaria]|uniref:uncharacterized protein LOC128211808 isoform X1 n=1 Tax=Mya arenaria TaxID=6604 RepID=UPI0022E1A394|nr:uncharacterized protein LOC128211808 isoform X1 [Mya arenaria]
MSNRKRNAMAPQRQLPPIINEDDGDLPFFKQDFFSDVALTVSTSDGGRGPGDHTEHGAKRSQAAVQTRKLYTARCLLAYNSPVFEKQLANAKKADLDLSSKNFDDIVELLCYLDPRVQYTLTASNAKQLLPLSEEYEMAKLRQQCETVLLQTYKKLRRDHHVGGILADINEEYLLLADRYNIRPLLQMCIEEYVANPDISNAKMAAHSDALSEKVKLLILQKKLAKLNYHLEKERRYRSEAEQTANRIAPKTDWQKYWHHKGLKHLQ